MSKSVLPALYAGYIPRIQATANHYGYAATVHGSLATDLDVVLVPRAMLRRPLQGTVDQIVESRTKRQQRNDRSANIKLHDHIRHGGGTRQHRLKAEGQSNGYPDLLLDVPRGPLKESLEKT